jgi:ribosomal protein S11
MIKKDLRLIKKPYFYFGGLKRAKLIFKRRYSNFFFILLDMHNKVICCKTSGCHGYCSNKKKKVSYHAIDCCIDLLLPYLHLYNIVSLVVILKDFRYYLVSRLSEYLQLKGIKISSLKFISDQPHNGVRGRKLRRV